MVVIASLCDASAQFAIDIEQCGRIVVDEVEFSDDLAGSLFLFDLFADEPLEFHQGRKSLLVEREFIQFVDLLADMLFLV